jgi:hypothetical protein
MLLTKSHKVTLRNVDLIFDHLMNAAEAIRIDTATEDAAGELLVALDEIGPRIVALDWLRQCPANAITSTKLAYFKRRDT